MLVRRVKQVADFGVAFGSEVDGILLWKCVNVERKLLFRSNRDSR